MVKDRRLFMLVIFIGLFSVIITAGCGGKSAENVVKKVERKLHDTNGYKVKAEMTMKTGQEARNYDVEIWYKKGQKDLFRVALENEEDDGGQVILKNEEGVFVLTPALKKSFKFQTDWPENSSQPYLYQSLVNDVLADKDAKFTTSDTHYIFFTKTNYQNSKNLPFQEVYFDKKSYTPTMVKIMDKDHNTLIEVSFDHIELNPEFQKSDFDREAILKETLASLSVSNLEQKKGLSVMYPLTTKGSELVEKQDIKMENGERVIMTFKGDRNFTLIQEKLSVVPASKEVVQEVSGDVVHLGHSIGSLTNNTLEWSYQGIDFYLASEDMTMDELVEVASSVQGQEIK